MVEMKLVELRDIISDELRNVSDCALNADVEVKSLTVIELVADDAVFDKAAEESTVIIKAGEVLGETLGKADGVDKIPSSVIVEVKAEWSSLEDGVKII